MADLVFTMLELGPPGKPPTFWLESLFNAVFASFERPVREFAPTARQAVPTFLDKFPAAGDRYRIIAGLAESGQMGLREGASDWMAEQFNHTDVADGFGIIRDYWHQTPADTSQARSLTATPRSDLFRPDLTAILEAELAGVAKQGGEERPQVLAVLNDDLRKPLGRAILSAIIRTQDPARRQAALADYITLHPAIKAQALNG